jgi:hypothetical protein
MEKLRRRHHGEGRRRCLPGIKATRKAFPEALEMEESALANRSVSALCLLSSKCRLTCSDMSINQFYYLLSLPLAIHLPSLHSFVVHAGLLPSDPTKHMFDPSQPLVASAESPNSDLAAHRLSEELSILNNVKQNQDPYTLIEMRSVHTHGKKAGKVTKDGSKGTPWSDVWNAEMKRCTKGFAVDEERREMGGAEPEESMDCSPISIVYGHAGEFGWSTSRNLADI